MNQPSAPKPIAQGRLSKTPFAHLLLHIYTKKLSGTLALWPDDAGDEKGFGQDRVLFKEGVPIAGRLVKRVSALDRGMLEFFQRTDAPFAFYREDLLGKSETVLRAEVNPISLIAASLRGRVDDAVIEKVLASYGNAEVRLRRDVDLEPYGFMGREDSFLGTLKSGQTGSIQDIVEAAKDDRTSRRVLYLLAITKALEPTGRTPKEEAEDRYKPRLTPPPAKNRPDVKVVIPEAQSSVAPRYRADSVPPNPADAPEPPPTLVPEHQVRWRAVTDKLAEIDGQNFFEMLDLAVDATNDEVQKAYIREVKKWHPDRNPPELHELKPWAERLFQQLTEARDTLGDTITRTRYLTTVRDGGGTPELDRGVQAIVNGALEVQKAEILYRRRDYLGAEATLRSALKLNADDPDIYALLSDTLFQLHGTSKDDSTHEIMLCLGKALSAHPEHQRALFVKARVMHRRGQLDEALKLYKKVVRLNPNHHEAARELRIATMRGANPDRSADKSSGLLSKLFRRKG